MTTFVDGRRLDDDGSVLLQFAGGARGILSASQVSIGEENDLRIRVYGEQGGLEWRQQEPNTLVLMPGDGPRQLLRAAAAQLSPLAAANTRLPMGHPEGFIEAFANLYRNFALSLDSRLQGVEPTAVQSDYPDVHDGVRGMAFIEAVVRSSVNDAQWTTVDS